MTSKKRNNKSKGVVVAAKHLERLIRTYRWRIICSVVVLVGVLTVFIPTTSTEIKSSIVPYEVEYTEDHSLELGDEILVAEGENGMRLTKYTLRQSIIGSWFKLTAYKTESSSEVVKKPTKKIVAKGTKRWQYMVCSDGSYRYFTDEQFKDPKTGFTSKSNDYCAENNQGSKVGLVDSMGGQTPIDNNHYSRSHSPNIAPGCHTENIVPYSSRKEERSYLPAGTSRVASVGKDGFTLVCPNLEPKYQRTVFQPYDEVIYVGTGKAPEQLAQEQAAADELRRQQELITKRNAQNMARTNCIRYLRANGLTPEQADYECFSIYPLI